MAASFQGFQSLIDNSPDAISLIDADGEILYESASTTMLFGYQPEELLGRNCLELIHPEDRDHSSRALQEMLAKPPGPNRNAPEHGSGLRVPVALVHRRSRAPQRPRNVSPQLGVDFIRLRVSAMVFPPAARTTLH
jgi:PAS domain S-box-containing protein